MRDADLQVQSTYLIISTPKGRRQTPKSKDISSVVTGTFSTFLSGISKRHLEAALTFPSLKLDPTRPIHKLHKHIVDAAPIHFSWTACSNNVFITCCLYLKWASHSSTVIIVPLPMPPGAEDRHNFPQNPPPIQAISSHASHESHVPSSLHHKLHRTLRDRIHKRNVIVIRHKLLAPRALLRMLLARRLKPRRRHYIQRCFNH